MTRPEPEQIRAALEDVQDGHIPVSLRRMGMLHDVSVSEDGVVDVEICVPCAGCPALGLMESRIEERLMMITGVTAVRIEAGMHLPWSPEDIDPEVRALMRRNGLQN